MGDDFGQLLALGAKVALDQQEGQVGLSVGEPQGRDRDRDLNDLLQLLAGHNRRLGGGAVAVGDCEVDEALVGSNDEGHLLDG